MKKLILNLFINLFWTILSFMVIGWYWGLHFAENRSHWVLTTSIVLSMLVFFLPSKWLSTLTLSKHRKTYEKLGLKFFRHFIQDGTLVNRHLRKHRKDFGVIRNRDHALSYLRTIAMQERYHYCCLVLFTSTSLCAIITGRPFLGLLLFMSNMLYNVYPILLQQYNRLRINAALCTQRTKKSTNNDRTARHLF